MHYQIDMEVAQTSEESEPWTNFNCNNIYNRMDSMGEKEYYDIMLARNAEKGFNY